MLPAMGRSIRGYLELLAYGAGFCVALALALDAREAWSGSWEAGGPATSAPRWTNDAHIADSVAVSPGGCIVPSPGQSAEYVPGIDAWGHPAAPADGHTGFVNSLPVEVDIELGRRRIGGHRAEISTGDMLYDPGHNSLGAYPPGRDCTP